MKISELIEELNRLKDEHGDLEVNSWTDDGYKDEILEPYVDDGVVIISP